MKKITALKISFFASMLLAGVFLIADSAHAGPTWSLRQYEGYPRGQEDLGYFVPSDVNTLASNPRDTIKMYNGDLYHMYVNGFGASLYKFDTRRSTWDWILDIGTIGHNASTYQLWSAPSFEFYNNKIYVAIGATNDGRDGSFIYEYNLNGSNKRLVKQIASTVGAGQGYVWRMISYNNKLYFAGNFSQLIEFDGTNIKTYILPNPSSFIEDMVIFNSKLYIATISGAVNNGRFAGILEFDGTTLVKGIDDTSNETFKSLVVYRNTLYVGANKITNRFLGTYTTNDPRLTYAGRLYTYNTSTKQLSPVSGYPENIEGLSSMAVYNDKLYVGTNGGWVTDIYERINGQLYAVSASGPHLYSFNGGAWQTVLDRSYPGSRSDASAEPGHGTVNGPASLRPESLELGRVVNNLLFFTNHIGNVYVYNNTLTTPVVAKPDFIVSAGPTRTAGTLFTGQNLTFSATIKNQSTGTSTTFYNRFQILSSNGRSVVTRLTSPSIAGGLASNATQDVTATWTATSTGTYKVQVCADTSGAIVGSDVTTGTIGSPNQHNLVDESNEGNNCADNLTINIQQGTTTPEPEPTPEPTGVPPVTPPVTGGGVGCYANGGVYTRFMVSSNVSNASYFYRVDTGGVQGQAISISPNVSILRTWAAPGSYTIVVWYEVGGQKSLEDSYPVTAVDCAANQLIQGPALQMWLNNDTAESLSSIKIRLGKPANVNWKKNGPPANYSLCSAVVDGSTITDGSFGTSPHLNGSPYIIPQGLMTIGTHTFSMSCRTDTIPPISVSGQTQAGSGTLQIQVIDPTIEER